MKELWKDILEYEGKYQISNLGRIRTKDSFVKNRHSLRFVEGGIRKNTVRKGGYVINSFYIDGHRKSDYIHRLVWRYFGNGKESNHKIVIDHIDNDKKNNCITNLRLIPARENTSKGMMIKKNRQTDFIGVRKHRKRFLANIYINGKRKYLGSFKTEIEAHNTYQKELVKILRKAC